MVPKWLTIYLANYVINQWPTAFGPISNPSAFKVLYLVKYFGGFKYFISHDIKNWFKNTVTLGIDNRDWKKLPPKEQVSKSSPADVPKCRIT
jgi:hypothetical protein